MASRRRRLWESLGANDGGEDLDSGIKWRDEPPNFHHLALLELEVERVDALLSRNSIVLSPRCDSGSLETLCPDIESEDGQVLATLGSVDSFRTERSSEGAVDRTGAESIVSDFGSWTVKGEDVLDVEW